MAIINPNDVKVLIENHREPLIFKDMLSWELPKWNLQKWHATLQNEELQFRIGKSGYSKEPQWERKTKNMTGSFNDFINWDKEDEWLYFDYKYLKDWFLKSTDIRDGIKWDAFGFPELTSDSSTIWIGTKGAHTPCHIDTYGFNLVAQIYGRKRWILFPPEERLMRSRIPYEESSIYSQINFHCPDVDACKAVSNCRSIILEPGQVLFVPNGWWHYVENLEKSISINTWIPVGADDETRIDESLVQMIVALFTKEMRHEEKLEVLNPNENFDEVTFANSSKIVEKCLGLVRLDEGACKKLKKTTTSENVEVNWELLECEKIDSVPVLTNDEFIDLMKKQRNRFTEVTDEVNNNGDNFSNDLINAFTDADVIDLIKKKLLVKHR